MLSVCCVGLSTSAQPPSRLLSGAAESLSMPRTRTETIGYALSTLRRQFIAVRTARCAVTIVEKSATMTAVGNGEEELMRKLNIHLVFGVLQVDRPGSR